MTAGSNLLPFPEIIVVLTRLYRGLLITGANLFLSPYRRLDSRMRRMPELFRELSCSLSFDNKNGDGSVHPELQSSEE